MDFGRGSELNKPNRVHTNAILVLSSRYSLIFRLWEATCCPFCCFPSEKMQQQRGMIYLVPLPCPPGVPLSSSSSSSSSSSFFLPPGFLVVGKKEEGALWRCCFFGGVSCRLESKAGTPLCTTNGSSESRLVAQHTSVWQSFVFFSSHHLRIDKIVAAKEEGDSIVAIKQQQQQQKKTKSVTSWIIFFSVVSFASFYGRPRSPFLKEKERRKCEGKRKEGGKYCGSVEPCFLFHSSSSCGLCVEFPLFIRGRSWGKYTKCFAFFFYTQKCQKIVFQYPIFSRQGSKKHILKNKKESALSSHSFRGNRRVWTSADDKGEQ